MTTINVATKMTIINITQEDIDSGCKGNCSLCPIALALSRTFNTREVQVSNSYIRVGEKWYFIPIQARFFIRSFDTYRAVQPFSFELVGL